VRQYEVGKYGNPLQDIKGRTGQPSSPFLNDRNERNQLGWWSLNELLAAGQWRGMVCLTTPTCTPSRAEPRTPYLPNDPPLAGPQKGCHPTLFLWAKTGLYLACFFL